MTEEELDSCSAKGAGWRLRRLAPSKVRGLLLSAMIAAGSASGGDECALCRGQEPVFSPDGAKLVFQRRESGKMCIMAYSFAAGRESTFWTDGKGDALWPKPGPDGSLLFVYGYEPETAHQAYKANKDTGFNVMLRDRDGNVRRLTKARSFEMTPSWSPDFKSVYFSSTHGMKPKSGDQPDRTAAFSVGLGGGSPTLVFEPGGNQGGVVDFRPSPTGKYFAWAEINDWGNALWYVVVAKASDLSTAKTVTPAKMAAYSPAWRPDGEAIVFTGYQEGDGGWRVYEMDFLKNRKMRVLARGKNPVYSPDGHWIAYERDGMIYRKEMDYNDKVTACQEARRNASDMKKKACSQSIDIDPPCGGFALSRTFHGVFDWWASQTADIDIDMYRHHGISVILR